jgi:Flp pilus assembly protein TadB
LAFWFLAFLAIAWLVVYLPSVWRAREHSPLTAVENFKKRMRLISPRASGGRWVVIPEAHRRIARSAGHSVLRRKATLIVLLVLVLATGVRALVIWDGAALEVHLVAVAATGFYAALLVDAKRKRKDSKVARLPAPSSRPVEEYEHVEVGGRSH